MFRRDKSTRKITDKPVKFHTDSILPAAFPFYLNAEEANAHHLFLYTKMDAIASLPYSHLRAILVALCHDRYTRAKVVDMANKLAAAPPRCNGHDLALCVQCAQAFSVIWRSDNSCRFHPGSRFADMDDDTWADYGGEPKDLETDEYMAEWPDAFIWDCCEERGSAAGCQTGPHKSQS